MELIWFLLGFATGLILLCGGLAWFYFRLKGDLERQGLILNEWLLGRSLRQMASTLENLQTNPSEQKQLMRSKNFDWQHILQNAPVGYLEVDAENHLCWANGKACNLLDIQSPHDGVATRRLLLQLVRSYELDLLIAQTRAAETAQQKKWVFHHVVPDPLHPVQQQGKTLRGHSVPLGNGQIGIFIEDCQEAAILQQQRDRWASDVAHELKTPLTSMRLIVEMLDSRVAPELREWIEHLLHEVMRLSNLVEDLLDLGQMDTGMSIRLNLKQVNLPTQIQSAWKSLEPQATQRHVSLEYQGPSNLHIQADESRVYRLLLNLFDNSIKYSPRSQVVLVKLGIENDAQEIKHAVIEVIDCGKGFPEAAIPHVFDRFYRVDLSRTRVGTDSGGSGLGLAIVRQIVQAHQGKIVVSNHPETGGAWVRVYLKLELSVPTSS